jgi:purine nucleoside permease
VFELNLALRDIAISLASSATLNDSTDAQVYRALYAQDSAYAAGSKAPSVVGCDVATSDVWFSGDQLSSAFANTTKLWTNGTGLYCTTAEEDNASLEAILRAASANLTDYSRVILFRTASDFDRPPPGVSNLQNLLYTNQGGFSPAIANIYLAGVKVVSGILEGWNSTFADGITPSNYVGDIFNTLGGDPNFGLAADYITPASNTTSSSKHKRGVFSSANQPQGNRRMKRAAAQGAKKHAALARKRTVRT